jgi:hypothetical protein
MENMDFGSGGSTMIQYIPTVDDLPPPAPEPIMDRQMGIQTRADTIRPGEIPPAGPGAVMFNEKTSEASNNTMMDFSTPISDVMPSASFEMDDSAPGGVNSAAYVSPTSNRVTAVSPGMIGAPPSKKSGNPLGLTDEQFQAAVAGLVALATFSKPVQDKLADSIPKFLSEAGDMTPTGMAVSAMIAAVLFYFALKFLKNQM